jgi:hypothetical protein
MLSKKEKDSVLVICHTPKVAKQISVHFPMCRTIKVWIYISEAELNKQYDYLDPQEREWRKDRVKWAWDKFLDWPVDYGLLNYKNPHDFERQLEEFIKLQPEKAIREILSPPRRDA